MKNFIISCVVTLFSLQAQAFLSCLIEDDKAHCLERLESADDAELWDSFLTGQAELFSNSEFPWIIEETWWKNARNVLEIGSGNGAYLSKLADQAPEKIFEGIEKLPIFVQNSNKRYAREGLSFKEGDAEVFNEALFNSSNLILFRFTLQHLKNPLIALQNAWHYLLDGGHILIIDSCDKAARTSHPITTIQKALKMVADLQPSSKSGNRKFTLSLLEILEEESSFSEFYEVVFTNLDKTGNILCESVRFSTEQTRKLYFNHSLLLLTLLHRTFQIPIDLSSAYDELKAYLEDKEAWNSPGMHFLVLKKKLKKC